MSAVRRKAKRSTAKEGVSHGRVTASVCSQQHHRTVGTSILHYGMKRRNVRPLAMVGMNKKQTDAYNDENCKQGQSLPSLTKNDDQCEVVPSRPPPCPLRVVVNTVDTSVPTPDSAKGSPTECRAVSLDGGQDMTALTEPLHNGTPVSHCKDSTTSSEQFFSLTEVTLLQLSQLSTQLPRPEAALIPPLLSSSPLPQATSENPNTHCLLHVKQSNGCHGSNHPIKEVNEELQKGHTSEGPLMPFTNPTTPGNLHSMKTSSAQQPQPTIVEGDFVCAKDLRESPVTVELPVVSSETAAKGTSDGCGEPSMTDSLADIMQCLDFDLSLSFQAMQISKGGQRLKLISMEMGSFAYLLTLQLLRMVHLVKKLMVYRWTQYESTYSFTTCVLSITQRIQYGTTTEDVWVRR